MPSLRDAFAALVVHSASVDVNPQKQVVAFPNFYFPMDAQDLDLANPDTAYAFALKVNMIPGDAPQFTLTDDFVWKAYKDVLTERVLPISQTGAQSYALQFADARAQFGDGLMMPTEMIYYPVATLPVDLGDARAWTPVILDAASIKDLAPKLSPDHEAWLSRFSLLARLGDDFVESVSLDRLTLVITRPWFNDSVFNWRFWDLPGKGISDGGENPRGLLPGVITKLVLVRNLHVTLAASLPPDVGSRIIFRRAPGPDPSPGDTAPMAQLARFAHVQQRVDQARLAFKSFGRGAAPVAEQLSTLKKEVTREGDAGEETSARDGAQKFHVPFSFDTSRARDHVKPLLVAASQSRSARDAELNALRQEMDRLRQLIAHPPVVRDHRRTPSAPPYDPVQRFKFELAQKLPQAQVKEQELAQAHQEEMRLQNVLSVLDQLANIQVDSHPYVLACVCDRTPKAPNPDPTLFPPA
jgi:hypothetical protein